MSDNPNLRKRDGNTVSWQKHEIEYVVAQLKKEFPGRSASVIRDSVRIAKDQVQPTEDRDKVLANARARLKK